MFQFTIKSGDKSFEFEGVVGYTSPRTIQQLAVGVFGDGVEFAVRAPAIGLFYRDTAKA